MRTELGIAIVICATGALNAWAGDVGTEIIYSVPGRNFDSEKDQGWLDGMKLTDPCLKDFAASLNEVKADPHIQDAMHALEIKTGGSFTLVGNVKDDDIVKAKHLAKVSLWVSASFGLPGSQFSSMTHLFYPGDCSISPDIVVREVKREDSMIRRDAVAAKGLASRWSPWPNQAAAGADDRGATVGVAPFNPGKTMGNGLVVQHPEGAIVPATVVPGSIPQKEEGPLPPP